MVVTGTTLHSGLEAGPFANRATANPMSNPRYRSIAVLFILAVSALTWFAVIHLLTR